VTPIWAYVLTWAVMLDDSELLPLVELFLDGFGVWRIGDEQQVEPVIGSGLGKLSAPGVNETREQMTLWELFGGFGITLDFSKECDRFVVTTRFVGAAC